MFTCCIHVWGIKMEIKYLVVDKDILPDVFVKVLKAKELLNKGEVKGVTDAVKKVGISRSTFYKYRDHVFPLNYGIDGKKVTLSMLLSHEKGILSKILNIIAETDGNILTINQGIPINGIANVTITFEISKLSLKLDDMMKAIKDIKGVIELNLLAME